MMEHIILLCCSGGKNIDKKKEYWNGFLDCSNNVVIDIICCAL